MRTGAQLRYKVKSGELLQTSFSTNLTMLFLVLASVVSFTTAWTPTDSGPCYFINGSRDVVGSPCYDLKTVGASMCCDRQTGDDCIQPGLCADAPFGAVGPYDNDQSIWRRSCSDYTWQDPACFAIAARKYSTRSKAGQKESKGIDFLTRFYRGNVAAIVVQLSRCEDGTYCARGPLGVNTACCNEKLGSTATLNDASVAPTTVSAIRSPQLSSSKATTTASNSTGPMSPPYKLNVAGLICGIVFGVFTALAAAITIWNICYRGH